MNIKPLQSSHQSVEVATVIDSLCTWKKQVSEILGNLSRVTQLMGHRTKVELEAFTSKFVLFPQLYEALQDFF